MTEVGRSKEITVAEEGRNTLRAFEYLLDESAKQCPCIETRPLFA
jgi:hypothetical protein